MRNRLFLLLPFILYFAGCASAPVVKKTYDFSRVKRVAVENFASYSEYKDSGRMAAQYAASDFVRYGIEVYLNPTAAELGKCDVIVTGSLLKYMPDKTQVISLRSSEQELTSLQVKQKDKQIIKYNEAQVSLSVIIKDVKTNEVIWANDYSYEGLDIGTAMDFAMRGALFPFIRSIR